MKQHGLAAGGDCAAPLGSTMKTRRSGDGSVDVALAETMRSPIDPVPSGPTPSGVRGRPFAANDLAPGVKIEGDYRIVEPIGSGAMGLVMCAHDERLDRRVAIKFVRPALLSAGFRERFAAEARAMARVNHPNVLHIYASGEHAGIPFFAMELVEGKTLEKWLDDHKKTPDLAVGLRILEETCLGVAAIHEAGTLHRDIKPSNILLDHHLHPRIADLGLAVLHSNADREPTEIVGTPAYMAPEAAVPGSVDSEVRTRADVYSLGCIAYEILTGQRPFDAASSADLLALHASATVRPPSAIRPELAPFDECILHALAKNPADRTATVDAFRREIATARDGGSEPVRILVAEDDADFRELMAMALKREFPDANVECVADGREALAAFDRRTPSVAIFDLQMPALSGLELTALIRSRESSQGVPILVLTGEGGPEEWRRLSALGADRFFVKPVVIDDVVSAVRRALRERTAALSVRG